MNKKVAEKFEKYPEKAKEKLLALRALIIDTAESIEAVGSLEETLKWGEPSYISKIGSTIRMDWKERAPDQYAMYFNCNTSLVETFRELYPDDLAYEGNRAIVFKIDSNIPVPIVKHCVTLALTYHKVKHLPMLGA